MLCELSSNSVSGSRSLGMRLLAIFATHVVDKKRAHKSCSSSDFWRSKAPGKSTFLRFSWQKTDLQNRSCTRTFEAIQKICKAPRGKHIFFNFFFSENFFSVENFFAEKIFFQNFPKTFFDTCEHFRHHFWRSLKSRKFCRPASENRLPSPRSTAEI